MPRARARGRRLLAALVIAVVIGGSTEAWAAFDSTSNAAHSVSTAVLEPPSGTAAETTACSALLLTSTATVTWTATPSTWADGYEVLTSSLSGGPYSVAVTVTGASTTTAELTSLALGSTTYIVVRASKGEWRSPGTPEITHTAPLICV